MHFYWQIHRASHAHSYLMVFKTFKKTVDACHAHCGSRESGGSERKHSKGSSVRSCPEWVRGLLMDGPTLVALGLMLSLFGLYWVERDMGDFVEDGFLSPCQAGWVRNEVVELLHLLRPMAVPLVDAWSVNVTATPS
ncbi:unnamed protein product [Choristocarpus tenellus]